MLRGEEAVQSIKAAAGTPPAPHSFPSALPFAAQAFDTAVPPLVTPPQRLRRRRGLLSATRRNRVPFPLGSARTPPPLTPCRVILVTETAAGIEGLVHLDLEGVEQDPSLERSLEILGRN